VETSEAAFMTRDASVSVAYVDSAV